jgi:2-iminobutanoate/2-iminopropanoate deaminase
MNKEQIITQNAPAAIGPYSQGIRVGDFLYTSGQLPIDKVGHIPDGIEAQAIASLENVKAVVEAGGSDMQSVIKVLIFVKNMNDFTKVNEVYSKYFIGVYPARSCVEVARLPKDALIEIEVVAVVKGIKKNSNFEITGLADAGLSTDN